MRKRALHDYWVIIAGWVEQPDRTIGMCQVTRFNLSQPNENIARFQALDNFKKQYPMMNNTGIVRSGRY